MILHPYNVLFGMRVLRNAVHSDDKDKLLCTQLTRPQCCLGSPASQIDSSDDGFLNHALRQRPVSLGFCESHANLASESCVQLLPALRPPQTQKCAK